MSRLPSRVTQLRRRSAAVILLDSLSSEPGSLDVRRKPSPYNHVRARLDALTQRDPSREERSPWKPVSAAPASFSSIASRTTWREEQRFLPGGEAGRQLAQLRQQRSHLLAQVQRLEVLLQQMVQLLHGGVRQRHQVLGRNLRQQRGAAEHLFGSPHPRPCAGESTAAFVCVARP